MLMEYSISQPAKTSPPAMRGPTPSFTLATVVKSLIVNALSFILAWHPTLAMLLGRVIWWLLPWLRGA
jgi:hypothetical protein